MPIISRGFRGRRRDDPALPPGQYLTHGFPVLAAGPTPRIAVSDWTFSIAAGEDSRRFTWDEFQALPQEDVTTDIHCVTSWSKVGTRWRGVSIDTLLAGFTPPTAFTMVHSSGGYTTNVPLADLVDGRAHLAWQFDGEPLAPEHGGPVRLIVPHLYFWKSAKWVSSLEFIPRDSPGFWERNGYSMRGDPWREQRYA